MKIVPSGDAPAQNLEGSEESPLLDYMNAHKLPLHLQERIVNCAFKDFAMELLLNRVFLMDEQHWLLPRGTLNTFLEIKTASAYFSVVPIFLGLSGLGSSLLGDPLALSRVLSATTTPSVQQVQVHKVMLCSLQWLREYFMEPWMHYQQGNPIVEIQASFVPEAERISWEEESLTATDEVSETDNETSGNDCSNFGNLSTSDMPQGSVLVTTQPILDEATTALRISSAKDRKPLTASAVSPIRSPIEPCLYCLERKPHGRAKRKRNDRGTRYRCTQCASVVLCEECYNNGLHDQTHAFVRVRQGKSVVSEQSMDARIKILQGDRMSLVSDAPLALAVPLEVCASTLDHDEVSKKKKRRLQNEAVTHTM